jgi:hypothetical protein
MAGGTFNRKWDFATNTGATEGRSRKEAAVARSKRGLVAALVSVFVLAVAPPALAQRQPIQGRVQQNQGQVPADEFASGGPDCNWNMGACDMLQAYVRQGGSDPRCLGPLEQGVALERQEQNLGKGARQSYALNKQLGALEQQRDRVLAKVPPDCFAAHPHPNWPTGFADTFASGPHPFGPDTIASGNGGPQGGPGQDEYGSGERRRRQQRPPFVPDTARRQPPRPPRPGPTPTSCNGPWIRTMHDMDSVVFDGYKTQPILLAAVCNVPNTWLVTLSGYQTNVVWWACVWTPWDCAGKYGQLTGLQEIFATSLGMEDNYSFALVQHMRAKQVPPQASIVLAGHSLGGMVAQSLPVNPALGFSPRWRAIRVLTFGAPVMYQPNLLPALVRRFAAQGYVIGVPQHLLVDPFVQWAPDWIKRLQLPTRVPFDYPTPQNTTLIDAAGEWLPPSLHVSYPKSAELRGYDALGYAPGATYLQLDARRMWRLPVGSPFPVAPPAEQRGLSPVDDVFLQNFARSNKLVVIVRDGNPWAVHWMGKPGYAPKPKVIKAKTLKPRDCADTLLLGLAAALDASEAAYYQSLGFQVAGADKCYVLSSKTGTRYYSDADLHGVYRSWLPGVGAVDQWLVDSTGLARTLNRSLSVPLIQHGPQDDWNQRNSPSVAFNGVWIKNGAYGPLPPVTAYLPEGGTAHLENQWQMKEFYLSRGIDWLKIYPNGDEQ